MKRELDRFVYHLDGREDHASLFPPPTSPECDMAVHWEASSTTMFIVCSRCISPRPIPFEQLFLVVEHLGSLSNRLHLQTILLGSP